MGYINFDQAFFKLTILSIIYEWIISIRGLEYWCFNIMIFCPMLLSTKLVRSIVNNFAYCGISIRSKRNIFKIIKKEIPPPTRNVCLQEMFSFFFLNLFTFVWAVGFSSSFYSVFYLLLLYVKVLTSPGNVTFLVFCFDNNFIVYFPSAALEHEC